MNIAEMHVWFRQYAQQMGMQNVRAILPEQIDLLINTSITDTVNSLIRENVGITNDRVITDNSKIGQINALRSLYKVALIDMSPSTIEEKVFNFSPSDVLTGKMTTDFVKPISTSEQMPDYLYLVDFSLNYKKTLTGYSVPKNTRQARSISTGFTVFNEGTENDNIGKVKLNFIKYGQQVHDIYIKPFTSILFDSVWDSVNNKWHDNIYCNLVIENGQCYAIENGESDLNANESLRGKYIINKENGTTVHLAFSDTPPNNEKLDNNYKNSDIIRNPVSLVDIYNDVVSSEDTPNLPSTDSGIIFDENAIETNFFPVRLIDDAYLSDSLNDFVLKNRLRSPIIVVYNENVFDLYIDKFIKKGSYYTLLNGLLPYKLRVSYISKPAKVKYGEDIAGNNIDCDLPDYMHVDILKHAVDLYRIAISGSLHASQQQEQAQQQENVRNNYRNEGSQKQQ